MSTTTSTTAHAASAPLRARAEIDLAALRANVRALRALAPGAALMAVVKSDAYGHGAVPCARAAVAAGATWLGTATPEEALALRAALQNPGPHLGPFMLEGTSSDGL